MTQDNLTLMMPSKLQNLANPIVYFTQISSADTLHNVQQKKTEWTLHKTKIKDKKRMKISLAHRNQRLLKYDALN